MEEPERLEHAVVRGAPACGPPYVPLCGVCVLPSCFSGAPSDRGPEEERRDVRADAAGLPDAGPDADDASAVAVSADVSADARRTRQVKAPKEAGSCRAEVVRVSYDQYRVMEDCFYKFNKRKHNIENLSPIVRVFCKKSKCRM